MQACYEDSARRESRRSRITIKPATAINSTTAVTTSSQIVMFMVTVCAENGARL
jgi:hypothetical protein